MTLYGGVRLPPRGGQVYLDSVRAAVERTLENGETLWYVASGVSARPIVDTPCVLAITSGRMLFFTQPPRPELVRILRRTDLVVEAPTTHGITARLSSGKATQIRAFEPSVNELLGTTIHRFVLGPTGVPGGEPDRDVSGLNACEYLGGHGLNIGVGELCSIAFQETDIVVRGSDGASRVRLPLVSVREIDFSGLGAYQTGLQFTGGGYVGRPER